MADMIATIAKNESVVVFVVMYNGLYLRLFINQQKWALSPYHPP
jgi:hypothetical protein